MEQIASILSPKLSQAEATKKLLQFKQGALDTNEFISELEVLAHLRFPSATDDNARDRCLTAALIAGVKNKHVSYELQNIRVMKTANEPSQICLQKRSSWKP